MARRGSDTSTVIGLLIGLGGLLGGFMLDGGSVIALVGIPALIIIVGVFVLLIAMAILLPILTMNQTLT